MSGIDRRSQIRMLLHAVLPARSLGWRPNFVFRALCLFLVSVTAVMRMDAESGTGEDGMQFSLKVGNRPS